MQTYDCLVIGSGIAGLSAALHAAEWGRVAVLCKAQASLTNTSLAQGGLAAVLAPGDSLAHHVADTLAAGSWKNNKQVVKMLVQEAPRCIEELSRLGVAFDQEAGPLLALGLEGGHSHSRIVHARDQTGLAIQLQLLERVQQHPNISLLEGQMALDLLMHEAQGLKFCAGVRVLDTAAGCLRTYFAKATILATGGAGQLYQHTTNPKVATGDGIAMALRAGVAVADMEFIQFHPTAFYDPQALAEEESRPVFLISEAVRGFGAELVLPTGESFMYHYHPQGSLAPRDVVSQAMQREMAGGKLPCLYLDLRHLSIEAFAEKFPAIYQHLRQRGLDPHYDLVPVVPAAHYLCGGIKTNDWGRTSLPGLWACGECACTGLHGANRLASNSLPEGWTMGRRAAANAADFSRATKPIVGVAPESRVELVQETTMAALLRQQLQESMWQYVGIVRSPQGLQKCARLLEQIEAETEETLQRGISPGLLELRNLVTVAGSVVKAALNRPQSCGSHCMLAGGQAHLRSDRNLEVAASQ